VLAIESQRSIILGREKLVREAEEAGITIVGVSDRTAA
jgi:DUF1009 family protein